MATFIPPPPSVDGITMQSIAGVLSVKSIADAQVAAGANIAKTKLAALNIGPSDLVAGVCKVARGQYTGTGLGTAVVVGFRPQLVLIQNINANLNRRGLVIDSINDQEEGARETGAARWTSADVDCTANGFTAAGADADFATIVYAWIAVGNAA